MPALIKSFSKKFNASVRNIGLNTSGKHDKKTPIVPSDVYHGCVLSANAKKLDEDEAEDTVPGFVPSDNSSSEDSSSSSEDENDAAEKYGYGDAAPDEPKPEKVLGISTPQYKRASLNRRTRRASISSTPPTADNIHDSVNVPFHPQRTPRRSSLKSANNKTSPMRRATVAALEDIDLKALEEIDPDRVLEVQLPGRRESIKRRRSIIFNEDVHVRKIQPAKTLTNKPKELWFQDAEYTTIKRKTKALLNSVDRKTGLVNGKKYCTRGLERYLEPSHVREATKYSAWDSVLIEQQFQRRDGKFCDESIGKSYRSTTRKSLVEAQRQAAKDAEEVASFYDLDGDDNSDNKENESPNGGGRLGIRRGRRASVA